MQRVSERKKERKEEREREREKEILVVDKSGCVVAKFVVVVVRREICRRAFEKKRKKPLGHVGRNLFEKKSAFCTLLVYVCV